MQSTLPAPLMNWCSLNAKRDVPAGVLTSWAASRKRASASCATLTSTPAATERSPAASLNEIGLARSGRPFSDNVRPRVSSTQTASGSLAKASRVGQANSVRARLADSWGRTAWRLRCGLVARSKVSPITFSGGMSWPKSFVATSATTFFLSALEPVLDIVADVPTQMSFSALKRSRKRRTKSATSAPCRPR